MIKKQTYHIILIIANNPLYFWIIMKRRHWFHYTFYGISLLFTAIMAYATVAAYSRHSGATGLDMLTIHKMRVDGTQKEIASRQ